MKYMGSKARIAKEILPIILKDRGDKAYLEPFAGGMNMICEVPQGIGGRYANDLNKYLIAMFKAINNGWVPPEYIEKELHKEIRLNKDKYEDCLVGWVGFNCSYSGDFFGGFAGKCNTARGVRNYQEEAIRHMEKQKNKLNGVLFCNAKYDEISIPENAIIYCDPPYEGTTGYKTGDFNHSEFWNWVRLKSNDHDIFVSEYNSPDDFEILWEKEVKSSLSANGVSGESKSSVERLFKLRK